MLFIFSSLYIPILRIYSLGMKYASQSEWDKLWQIYKEEDDVQEQAKLRSALAAPHDVEILQK